MSRIIRLGIKQVTISSDGHRTIPLYTDITAGNFTIINWLHDSELVYFLAYCEYLTQTYLQIIYQDQAGWIWLGNLCTIHELDELPDDIFSETLVYPRVEEPA